MNTKTAFVTGATGLVGTHLLYELLKKGYRVKALKRKHSNIRQVQKTFSYYTDHDVELFQKIEWFDGELLDFHSMLEAVEGCSIAYHAAAVVSFNKAELKNMMRINVSGTANMVNVCLEKAIPVCHVSSIAALGRGEMDSVITENDMWQTERGRSAYSCSKYKAEMEVWRGIAEGLNAVIVNPAVIIGPGDWTKGSAKFFSQVHKGLRFYTTGATAFVDVRDVCSCMIQLTEQQYFGERFIIAADNMSYRVLFDTIAEELDVKKPAIEAKPWMLKTACRLSMIFAAITGKKSFLTKEAAQAALQKTNYSGEKIQKTLGYKYISLNESIKHCCEIKKRKETFNEVLASYLLPTPQKRLL